MAKKSRRARRGGKRRRTASPLRKKAAPVAAPTIAEPAERIAPPLTVAPQRKTIDFSEEYRYVYSDLKRIAILAACMFTLLIALSFVIK